PFEIQITNELAPVFAFENVAQRFIKRPHARVVRMILETNAPCSRVTRCQVKKMHEGFAGADALAIRVNGDSQTWNLVALIPTTQHTVTEHFAPVDQQIIKILAGIGRAAPRLVAR